MTLTAFTGTFTGIRGSKVAIFFQYRFSAGRSGKSLTGVSLIGIIVLLAVGCGGPGYPLAKVSGTVSMNGKPLPGAILMFSPSEGQPGPSSSGKSDSEGNFELMTIDLDHPGAVPGQHRVTITTATASGDDERAKISREIVPPKYRDGSFKFEVPTEGTEVANIEIVTN